MTATLTDENGDVVESEDTEIRDPEAVLAALERAKKDAQKYRQDSEALRKQLSETKVDKYKERAVKSEAKLALQEKGIKNPDRIIKHMNLADLDFDEDGNLAGLEGRIAELKEDFPELFSKKHQAGAIDQFSEGVKAKPLTASEIQARQIRGF